MSTPIRRRNRRIISCLNCRKRKRKCDRELPCLNCKRYNIANTCTYDATGPPRTKKASATPTAAPAMQQELVLMKDRLNQIEASIAVATLHRGTAGPSAISVNDMNEDLNGNTSASLGISNNDVYTMKAKLDEDNNASPILVSDVDPEKGHQQAKSHKYLISHISHPARGQETLDVSELLNSSGDIEKVPVASVDASVLLDQQSGFVVPLPSASPFMPNVSTQSGNPRYAPLYLHPSKQAARRLPVLPSLILPRHNDVHIGHNGLASSMSQSPAANVQQYTPSPSNNLSPSRSSIGTGSNIFIGPYPLESSDEEVFFHASPPRDYREALPPPRTLRFKALLRFDPGIQFFWKYRPFIKPDTLIKEKMIYIAEEKIDHYTKEAKRIYADGYIPHPEETNDVAKIKLAITKFACRVGLNFAPNVDYSVNLLTRVKLMLSGIEITPYVNKFFRNLYSYFPIIEQDDFIKDISRILGEDLSPTTTCQNLRFEKRDDLATVGILLLILRWVSVSDIQFKYDPQSHLLVPTDESSRFGVLPIEFVDLAEDCVKEININRFISIRILQCILCIRGYRLHAPEEADPTSGVSSQVIKGVTVHMAFCLGLNRDPSKIANYDPDPKIVYQQKKLWSYVSKLDLMDSLLYGSVLSTSEETYDLNELLLSDYNGSMKNYHIEKMVIDFTIEFNRICSPLRRIVQMTNDLQTPVKLKELLEEVNKLEGTMKHVLGEFSKYLDPNYFIQKLVKAWKFVMYLHCQMSLCYIYHVLFLHYERKGNYQLMLFYFNKYIFLVVSEWAQLTPQVLAKAFDGTGWLLIAPTLQLLYQMLLLVSNTSMLRLSAGLTRMETENIDDPARKEALFQLRQLMEDTSMSKMKGLYSLRNRYSTAWKLSKVHFGVFPVLNSSSCLDRAKDDGFLVELEYSLATSDIQNIVSLLSMHRTEPLLTVQGLIGILRNRPDKCLAESIQIDNMWIHMANFFHDPDSVPPTCQNDGTSGLSLEPTSYSIFPTDFEPFGNMLLFQI